MTETRRYRVLASVGRGVLGTVYIAEMLGQGGFSKVVALKVYDGDHGEVIGKYLRDEIHAATRIRHRAAVQVHALLKLDGHWSVAMEYVDGMSIDQLARRDKFLPVTATLDMAREVASALHAASTAPDADGVPLGVVHRDVLDANVKITETGGVKLLDFGIAHAEFRAGRARDHHDRMDGHAGDIYGLGRAMVRALTGHVVRPVAPTAQDHQGIVGQALRQVEATAGVGAYRVKSLIGSMLAFDPAARPTAREVEAACADLRRQLHGPSLRDWAEWELPHLAEERTAPRDLPRVILVETPVAPTLGRSAAVTLLKVVAAIATGASLALCIGVSLGVAWLALAPAPAPERTEVRVSGDGVGVSLSGETSVFPLPAAVPPGRYTVEVSFTPGKRIGAGVVDIPPGGPVSIDCKSESRACLLLRAP